MKRIVLTGGTSCGKTTIIKKLAEHFTNGVIFIPEVATLLMQGGYPKPGCELPWSVEWHELFQDAIFHVQKSIELTSLMMAAQNNAGVIVFDRGLLDVAGHMPGGIDQFCQRYNTSEEESLARYDMVIHLVSLAILDRTAYNKIAEARWGKTYFGSAEYAIKLEQSILQAWVNHKNIFIVDGNGDINKKTAETIKIIERVLV